MYSDFWETDKLLHRISAITDLAASLPTEQQKPIYLTEFGFRGHRKGTEEPGTDDNGTLLSKSPMLGVLIGWRMIDALDHGFVTMLFWDAYAVMYDRDVMPYGLVGEAREGWPLRPHYHLMRMFTHTSQPGWHAVSVDGETDELRGAAMAGDKGEFTIYAVNRGSDSRAITIDGAPASTTFAYLAWNGDGTGNVSTPAKISSDANGRIKLDVAPQTVVALSTHSRY
jgi:hypothetical protein